MNVLAVLASEDITQTPSKYWPEGYEIAVRHPRFAAGVRRCCGSSPARPIKKGMAARTAKIQAELDAGEADRVAADAEAARIRQAKGDIAAERARLLAEADAQASALLEDGRARLAQELVELDARAEADIVAAAGRSGDELRAEIARLSAAAVDHVVTGSIDAATHQELIENFIAKVGAGISA